jgi:hypothetical protein
MQMSGDEGISAFPKDDNLFEWLGTIHGSDGTVYEGLEYKITLKFGPKYPNEPPQVHHPLELRALVTLCSVSSRRACSTPTSTHKAATSASTSSPLTSGLPYWT